MEPAALMAALSRRGRRWLVLGLAIAALGPRNGVAQAAAQGPQDDRVAAAPTRELVVVAHGMGRSIWSMRPLAKALEREGYDVMLFGYSSYCCEIAEIGAKMQRKLAERMTPQHTKVHFVGHSLGNIVVRWVLTRDTVPERVGRIVMLAPPNQGAQVATDLTPWVGWLLRPITELRADSGATVRGLPRLTVGEVGVIAGRDDRTVKVHETHLPEERAHAVVPGGHTFIMRRRETQALTIRFLRSGQFADSVVRVAADPPL